MSLHFHATHRRVARLIALVGLGLAVLVTAAPPAEAAPPVVWRAQPVTTRVAFTPSGIASNPFSPNGRLLAGSSTSGGVQQAAVYDVVARRVRLLGPAVPGSSSAAIDVNDRGDVVGTMTAADGPSVFVLDRGTRRARDLGTFGGRALYPYAMNNSGTVVGSWLGPTNEQAFRWVRPGRRFELLDLGVDATESRASGVDSAGRIIGEVNLGGFVWDPRTRTSRPIAGPADGRSAYPRDLNDRGVVVGVLDGPGDDDNEGFRYSLSTRRLTILPGGEAIAKTVSRSGVVSGWVGLRYAATWNGSSLTVLGQGSPAYANAETFGQDARGAVWAAYAGQLVRWVPTRACA